MPNMELTCPVCGMGFTNMDELNLHTQKGHMPEKATEPTPVIEKVPEPTMPVVEKAPEPMPVERLCRQLKCLQRRKWRKEFSRLYVMLVESSGFT